jgi:hypothetical protein
LALAAVDGLREPENRLFYLEVFMGQDDDYDEEDYDEEDYDDYDEDYDDEDYDDAFEDESFDFDGEGLL